MNPIDWEDSIVALASPAGAAPRGIIRISGNNTLDVLQSLLSTADYASLHAATYAQRFHCTLALQSDFDAATYSLPADIYYWPNKRSYTGQVMAELHTIGSPALLEAVLARLTASGARLARPGEFTLRAFLAGRIDLLQAEAVLGVIDAANATEFATALKQLAGGISNPLVQLRSELLNLLADLEAGLDFVEEDIEFVAHEDMLQRLQSARSIMQNIADQADSRSHSNSLPLVVLAGFPNAGKSTLFNQLAGREQALISHHRGTTRDFLTARIEHGPVPYQLIDTAGLDSPTNEIEAQSQNLRNDQLEQADLICWCTAADLTVGMQNQDAIEYEELQQRSNCPCIRITTKSDLNNVVKPGSCPPIAVSVHDAKSIQQFNLAITSHLTQPDNTQQPMVSTTSARCREHCHRALHCLDEAIKATQQRVDSDLIAIDIRSTLDELGQMVGAVYTDDLLDRIFSRFCIGK